MQSSAPATRERLSRDVVAAGALDLADREGLEAVTIRRLATDNSVTPMALYWHFKDKDAVLDGIAEQIYKSVVLAGADRRRLGRAAAHGAAGSARCRSAPIRSPPTCSRLAS